eukprot:UN21934
MEIRNKIWPTQKRNWCFWVPWACGCFTVIPLQYQLIYTFGRTACLGDVFILHIISEICRKNTETCSSNKLI